MKLGIIVQARMGSTRLPGKILKEFYNGKTLIEILLDKLHQVPNSTVIVATSDSLNNDELEKFLVEHRENVSRGSEDDVLNRFISAAEEYGIDRIIRICSDNPFIDIDGLKILAEHGLNSEADYIGYRINGKPSILTHFGFWGEFVKLDALKHVAATTDCGTPAHEHVTYHIYNHPDEYKCEWIPTPVFLQNRDDIRLTIDTPDDLTNAIKVYSGLITTNPSYTLHDVVNYLDANEDIKVSMLKNISQNKKK